MHENCIRIFQDKQTNDNKIITNANMQLNMNHTNPNKWFNIAKNK